MLQMTTAQSLAQNLRNQQPLDPNTPLNLRIEAIANLIDQGAQTVTPSTASPRRVAQALAKLEELAGLKATDLTLPWLGLRTLDLKPGKSVGGAIIEDPIVASLIKALKAVPTFDPTERVNGVLGDLGDRPASSLGARARQVTWTDRILEVSEGGQTILSADPSQSMESIIAAIDAIPTRHAAAKAQASATALIAYDAIQPVERTGGDTLFQDYMPGRLNIHGAKKHPTALVESAALASVSLPTPHYQPNLPASLANSGALTDIQIESIVYAGQAHAMFLQSDPDDPTATPPRQGILIGHGTGVGKGKIIAGIMLDNWRQGRRRAIWSTENHDGLISARRDWVSIGGSPEDIIDLSAIPLADDIPRETASCSSRSPCCAARALKMPASNRSSAGSAAATTAW